MIIKSHIRGGYRSAAQYLNAAGQNEKIRLVEISDLDAGNLDDAFRNMWVIASSSRVKKPLHHISINPFQDERLTDDQVRKVVERAEQKYGYKLGDHQRVIVEHVLNGRQHFHVIWNRVSLTTNRAVWPGEHWKKSKQVAREMEQELGLKRPVSRRGMRKQTSGVDRKRGGSRVYGQLNRQPKWAGRIKVPRKGARPEFERLPQPIKPVMASKGWPEAAILAWETWGKHNPTLFFQVWSELAPPEFSPN